MLPNTTEFFHKAKRNKDGSQSLDAQCKGCIALYHKEHNKKNPEKRRERNRAWTKANPEKAKAKADRYYSTEKGKAAKKRNQRTRYDNYWLTDRIASQVRNVIGGRRGASQWPKLLGYTPEELRRHIERQFTKGMSWEKMMQGLIHLDHIIPVSSFEIAGPNCPNLKACWSLSNLRPLWAKENMSKHSKRLHLL